MWEGIIENYFRPDLYYSNIYDIDLSYLKRQGIKGLICDLDNTLLAWDNQSIRPEVKEWIIEIKDSNFDICILSNSLQTRVNKIANNLELISISRAFKPRKKAFKLAMNKLDVSTEEVAVIGDQLFTDIYGGNRLKLLTILVEPITKKELISTKLIRHFEARIKNYLEFKGSI